METSFITALLLGGAALAVWLRLFGKTLRPAMLVPLAELPAETRRKVEQSKVYWRGASVLFLLAAAGTLSGGYLRGVTLGFTLLGFFCQYRVYCLRRLYPALPGTREIFLFPVERNQTMSEEKK